MVVKLEQEKIRTLLTDTITLLLKNGLAFQDHFSVEALIGVTLDSNNVFLVSINETVTNGLNQLKVNCSTGDGVQQKGNSHDTGKGSAGGQLDDRNDSQTKPLQSNVKQQGSNKRKSSHPRKELAPRRETSLCAEDNEETSAQALWEQDDFEFDLDEGPNLSSDFPIVPSNKRPRHAANSQWPDALSNDIAEKSPFDASTSQKIAVKQEMPDFDIDLSQQVALGSDSQAQFPEFKFSGEEQKFASTGATASLAPTIQSGLPPPPSLSTADNQPQFVEPQVTKPHHCFSVI